jgi:hypothetical protein
MGDNEKRELDLRTTPRSYRPSILWFLATILLLAVVAAVALFGLRQTFSEDAGASHQPQSTSSTTD